KESPIFLRLLEDTSITKSEFKLAVNAVSDQVLTSAKKRLHTHLLQCLHEHYKESSGELLIYDLLGKVEILYERGFPQQGAVLLAKAYTLALSHEFYGILLQVLNWERRINAQLDFPKRTYKEIDDAE